MGENKLQEGGCLDDQVFCWLTRADEKNAKKHLILGAGEFCLSICDLFDFPLFDLSISSGSHLHL